ncbi:hypothetical protein CI102_9404, partial [Trichoderma harzianum]
TEDVDIVAPPDVLICVWNGVRAAANGLSLEPDGRIAYDASQGFRVRVDLIEMGGGYIDHIHHVEPFLGASLASKADLLRLRAATAADRGDDGDMEDFRWLVEALARKGEMLPQLNQKEADDIINTGKCMDPLDQLVLVAVMGINNQKAALMLLGI